MNRISNILLIALMATSISACRNAPMQGELGCEDTLSCIATDISATGLTSSNIENHGFSIAWNDPNIEEVFVIEIEIKGGLYENFTSIATIEKEAEDAYVINNLEVNVNYAVRLRTTTADEKYIDANKVTGEISVTTGSESGYKQAQFTNSECDLLTCRLNWDWSNPIVETSAIEQIDIIRTRVGTSLTATYNDIGDSTSTTSYRDDSMALDHGQEYHYTVRVTYENGHEESYNTPSPLALSYDLSTLGVENYTAEWTNAYPFGVYGLQGAMNTGYNGSFPHTIDLNLPYTPTQITDAVGPVLLHLLYSVTNNTTGETSTLPANLGTAVPFVEFMALTPTYTNQISRLYAFSDIATHFTTPQDWTDYTIEIIVLMQAGNPDFQLSTNAEHPITFNCEKSTVSTYDVCILQ